MSKYVTPPNLPSAFEGVVDPNGGFLCVSSRWRPDPEADDPEWPGHKLSMSSYIPVLPREACLCGSGRRYGDCCQPKRFWYPICPNPGMEGYSLTAPQSATFGDVDVAAIRRRLMADPRFRCTGDSRASAFWIYHGDPVVEDQHGLLYFGDLELKDDLSLLVTAMSDLRMQTLLAVLQEVAGELLDEPRRSRDSNLVIDKRTGKMRTVEGAKPRSRRRRKR